MKKSTSIRLFLVLATAGCCAAYGGGYYFSIQQSEKHIEQELAQKAEEQEEPESTESAVVVPPYEFILREEDGYIMVYCADGETVYSNTDIRLDSLPSKIRKEIQEGKLMYSEQELYNFLESYSS